MDENDLAAWAQGGEPGNPLAFDPLTGGEPECCRCRDHHDPMRNCTDCAWCMNGCPMPWPAPPGAEFCKGCDGR